MYLQHIKKWNNNKWFYNITYNALIILLYVTTEPYLSRGPTSTFLRQLTSLCLMYILFITRSITETA